MQMIYLETSPGSDIFNRRGETGPDDDARSYAEKMGKRGLRVIVAEKDFGPRMDSKFKPLPPKKRMPGERLQETAAKKD